MRSSSYMLLIQKLLWMHSKKIIKGDNNVEKEIDGSCAVCE